MFQGSNLNQHWIFLFIYINTAEVCCSLDLYDNKKLKSAFHQWIGIFGRAQIDSVLNSYIEMLANQCDKNVPRIFEAHFWKKIRKLSLDEKITILINKKRVLNLSYNLFNPIRTFHLNNLIEIRDFFNFPCFFEVVLKLS